MAQDIIKSNYLSHPYANVSPHLKSDIDPELFEEVRERETKIKQLEYQLQATKNLRMATPVEITRPYLKNKAMDLNEERKDMKVYQSPLKKVTFEDDQPTTDDLSS